MSPSDLSSFSDNENNLICKTELKKYIKIGEGGRNVFEILPKLLKTLEYYILDGVEDKELKQAYLKIFSTMEIVAGNVHCYASEYFGPSKLKVKKLTSLPLNLQNKYKIMLARALLDIRNKAKDAIEKYKNPDLTKQLMFFYNPNRKSPFGFGVALQFPSFDNIYIVEGSPVMTMYGFEQANMNESWYTNTKIEEFISKLDPCVLVPYNPNEKVEDNDYNSSAEGNVIINVPVISSFSPSREEQQENSVISQNNGNNADISNTEPIGNTQKDETVDEKINNSSVNESTIDGVYVTETTSETETKKFSLNKLLKWLLICFLILLLFLLLIYLLSPKFKTFINSKYYGDPITSGASLDSNYDSVTPLNGSSVALTDPNSAVSTNEDVVETHVAPSLSKMDNVTIDDDPTEVPSEKLAKPNLIKSGIRFKRNDLQIVKKEEGIVAKLFITDIKSNNQCTVQAKITNTQKEENTTIKTYKVMSSECNKNQFKDLKLPDFTCEIDDLESNERCYVGISDNRQSSVSINFAQ